MTIEEKRAYCRAWMRANRARANENERRWRKENRARYNARKRGYYEKHKEKCMERVRRYRAKENGKIQMRECAAKQRLKNPKKVKLCIANWKRKYPERVLLHTERRRARKFGAAGSHTMEQWLARVEFYGWRCAYCRVILTAKSLTKDHRIPLSKGGSEFASNLVPCCKSCNSRKKDRKLHLAYTTSRMSTSPVTLAG